MRFGLSPFRFDEQTIDGIPVPQIVSAVIIGIAIMLAGIIRRYPGQITSAWEDRVFGVPSEIENEEEPRPSST